jgi:hypothetical protein
VGAFSPVRSRWRLLRPAVDAVLRRSISRQPPTRSGIVHVYCRSPIDIVQKLKTSSSVFASLLLPKTEIEMRLMALSLCVLAMLPAAAGAQQLSKTAPVGPTLQSAAVGFRVSDAKVDGSTKVTAAPVRPRAGQDVALMAVGVGAMIVGALVGDTAGTIIIIGGAGMALFGLYHYLE